MRTMYDAVTPANIPADAQMVAGYLNGTYAWSAADWARFPNAVHVGISVRAALTVGNVLDVETGDATPAESVGWVQARRAAGADPTVYCNASTWPAVRAAFAAAGVAEPHYWIAKYDSVPTLDSVPGAIAKQHDGNVPPGIDISTVADYWPGVDAAAPFIPGTTQEDNTMRVEAGTNVITAIPCNGARSLFIQAGFGHVVNGSMWLIADTNPQTQNGSYVGALAQPLFIASDRPGPIALPAGVRAVSLQTTCAIPFTAWCA